MKGDGSTLLSSEMEHYLQESQEELQELVRQLCAIPAPSHHEERRADFCLHWFWENGCEDAFIDDASNVICPIGVQAQQPVAVFMAHMDTVFPDTTPLPQREADGKLWCPGVCDDTANLAVLMICARYVFQRKPSLKYGLVFAANSCEEGLGNLKGCREICHRYGNHMQEFVTLDGFTLNELVNQAVGSHRYQVTVRTEGGHSFSAFGNRNAIHILASMIDTLYTVKVPQEGSSTTTYNVGLISGGTSVNTIAQEASMLYEYRSDSRICMEAMQHMFEKIVEAYRATGVEIEVEKIGDRPCAGEVDPIRQQALVDQAKASIRSVVGLEPYCCSGSTDANIPLSMGIPSLCLATCNGKDWHTRNEVLEWESLLPGSRIFLSFLSNWLR